MLAGPAHCKNLSDFTLAGCAIVQSDSIAERASFEVVFNGVLRNESFAPITEISRKGGLALRLTFGFRWADFCFGSTSMRY